MSQTNLLDQMPVDTGFNEKSGQPSFVWLRWLQSLTDLINRIVLNRVTASTSATAVALNGSAQSSGVGTGSVTPKRYAEFLVQARVTFNISGAGVLRVAVYRTTGAVPANGAAPGGTDIAVGGDYFAGPATVGGQNVNGAMAWIDSGLNKTTAYKYYLVLNGTNTLTGNLVNSSQIMVSEI